ncbi:HlyD family efflux transporter periplasmic adaptor subunit [Roseomonas sp. CCTCC AB2023176]|uniref:HlyD family efflux transporter periplasmic adaptor subunit n=1 Tax=Roseomonas sp. CCTCC AB2023176 TaxID=3342640 RepID=UPI0035DBAE85
MNASARPIPDPEIRVSEPAPPPPRRSRLRRLLPVIGLVAAVGAGLGGTWWWNVARFLESTDNAYVGGDISVLSPRIEGDVARILVADNATVTAGQPLIELEDRDARARRDQAAANLAEAEASIGTIAAQRGQAEAAIAQAQAGIAEADAERVRAAADAARTGSLVAGGFASRQTNDLNIANQRKAEAAVQSAQANLRSAQQQLPVLDAQARAAVARRDAAAAALALAESNVAYTVIRAPFDGIAGNRAAQPGQHVRPGQNLIAVAPPAERQFITANFKETQIRRMRVGQPVDLNLDAGGVLHGTVDSLAPATGSLFSLLPPENATGNFTKIVQRVPVRIALAPGQDVSRLRPGLSVEAEVDTRDDPNAPRGVIAATASALNLR